MFKNVDKQKFVINDVFFIYYGCVWIGLSCDLVNKMVWRWDDGFFLIFVYWQYNELNNWDEDCVQMVIGWYYNGKWNDGWFDIYCYDFEGNFGFVCEREVIVFFNLQ